MQSVATPRGVAASHFVPKRHQNTRSPRADRVAQRNRAAIDIDPRRIGSSSAITAKLCAAKASLISQRSTSASAAGSLQKPMASRDRPQSHHLRIDTGMSPQ